MRKVLYITIALALFVAATQPVFAAGDKHHGDKGQGSVVQNQVRNN